MRISDQMLKCVGFVSRHTEPLTYGGTAFVVGVGTPDDRRFGCLHLVTARHVAKAIGPDFVIAMNGKDGMPLFVKGREVDWFYHPTEAESVDVAVMPFASTRINEYDLQHIPIDMFVTDERIAAYEIGLGDEIVNIGLFTPFIGRSRLIPIVRTGNIAMMPVDKIPIKQFGDIDAYLAEGRSIGGLSGSPLVNMGVSIIIPAKKILEVLFSPELVAVREEAFKRQA